MLSHPVISSPPPLSEGPCWLLWDPGRRAQARAVFREGWVSSFPSHYPVLPASAVPLRYVHLHTCDQPGHPVVLRPFHVGCDKTRREWGALQVRRLSDLSASPWRLRAALGEKLEAFSPQTPNGSVPLSPSTPLFAGTSDPSPYQPSHVPPLPLTFCCPCSAAFS